MYSELLNCIYLHLAHYHSLSYSIYPTILHYLSDHNYIIPLIKPRFFCSNYDWSISLASKWFNHTTCPFTIYLPPFVSIIFSPFFFFLSYLITTDLPLFYPFPCLIIATPIRTISFHHLDNFLNNYWKQVSKKFLLRSRVKLQHLICLLRI